MVLDLATLVADKALLSSLTREYEQLKASDGAVWDLLSLRRRDRGLRRRHTCCVHRTARSRRQL